MHSNAAEHTAGPLVTQCRRVNHMRTGAIQSMTPGLEALRLDRPVAMFAASDVDLGAVTGTPGTTDPPR